MHSRLVIRSLVVVSAPVALRPQVASVLLRLRVRRQVRQVLRVLRARLLLHLRLLRLLVLQGHRVRSHRLHVRPDTPMLRTPRRWVVCATVSVTSLVVAPEVSLVEQ